ncbi:MAG: glycosyltransferase [Planctomycetota bacterium]
MDFSLPRRDRRRVHAPRGAAGERPLNPVNAVDTTGVALEQAARGRTRSAGPGLELSILIPTYNEAGNMPELLRRIARVVCERSICCEVLVLDDGSPDGTAEAARQVDVPLAVRVIERSGPRGLSPAVIEGIELARGAHVLVMDADLQHPPESLVDLLVAVRNGADVAIGSRHIRGGTSNEFGFYRRLNSKAAALLAAPLVGRKVRDPMAGFFCFRRELIGGAELSAVGYKIGLEILVKCRPKKVVEVPIQFGPRHAGLSKLNLLQQIDYLRHLRRLYGWRWPRASQWALFCAVGSAGMVVDLTLMTLLVYSGMAFTLARVLSILSAMMFNFLLNRRVTFPEAVRGNCPRQLAKFVGVCSLGMCINWALSSSLYVLIPALRWAYQLYCLAGIAAGTVSNFLLSKYVAFRVPLTGRED